MIQDILEEHVDEIVDLFERRLLSFQMLDVTRRDLQALDERLVAHLDGLSLGVERSWELCKDFLSEGSTGQAFTAGMVALDGGAPERLEALESAMRAAPIPILDGIQWACSLSSFAGIAGFLRRQWLTSEPTPKAIALEALTFRRIETEHAMIEVALRDSDPRLVAAGIRSAGAFRLGKFQRTIQFHMASDDPAIATLSLECMVLLSGPQGRDECRRILHLEGQIAPAAAILLGALGHDEDVDSLKRAAASKDENLSRAGILALGELGTVAGISTLVDALEHPTLGGVAGAALVRVVGPGVLPSAARPDPGESETWSPDDDLPKLARQPVRTWWDENAHRFTSGARLRQGIPKPDAPDWSTPLPWLHLEEIAAASIRASSYAQEVRQLQARIRRPHGIQ